ncbi:MAG: bifunctional UDP-N-acetylglucosamine diphosphorylase/glucosamine-1-phosphate N-acetyltransferase GlmU [Acidobacteria bacterium]|nr:bifunctional UDP-N-acetylglucosamine diphosphorylase/glucosamine-1-phosphate N-acetyltransferase GlmU [Acidobacteriota bacterium]
MRDRLTVVILAAGQGTRFRSQRVKVLHSAGGRTLIEHVVHAAQGLSPHTIFIVVGHQAEAVIGRLKGSGIKNLKFIHQKEQLGTGHALRSGKRELAKASPLLLVLCGDTPLLTPHTLRKLVAAHRKSSAAATVLTAEMDDPSGYGRIIRAEGGSNRRGENRSITAIVEHKSASPEQLQIREVNTSIYCFQTQELFAALERVRPDPTTREYYLTDVIGLLAARGHRVAGYKASDSSEIIGINSRAELARVDSLLRARKARQLMLSGVTMFSPETVRIDPDVRVGADTEIEPGAILLGRTRIGKDCRIGAYSVITDSELADEVTIRPSCVITESRIARGASIGPFAHLRPGAEIGEEARVGNFVEVKKSRLGRGSKASHLTYLGDATIGKDVNVGCGSITVNYDGAHKHQTVVEDNAFVGSGANLIAPVRIGRNAFVAAGSTISEDVPANALAIGRARQTIKPGWVTRRKKKRATFQRKH